MAGRVCPQRAGLICGMRRRAGDRRALPLPLLLELTIPIIALTPAAKASPFLFAMIRKSAAFQSIGAPLLSSILYPLRSSLCHIAFCLAIAVPSLGGAERKSSQPNFIFILSDDLGYND